MCMCACHMPPGGCFSSGFSLVFLFISLKIIFPFRNKFTRKPAPLPPRWTGCSHLFLETVLIFPHIPKQELLRMASEGWSLSLSGGRPGGGKGPSATMEVSDCGTQSGFYFLLVF